MFNMTGDGVVNSNTYNYLYSAFFDEANGCTSLRNLMGENIDGQYLRPPLLATLLTENY